MSGAKKKLLAVEIAILLLFAGGYVGTAIYFQSHFFPKTTISGMDCGKKTADDVEEHNIRTGEDYLLSVFDREGNKYHLKGSDFGYAYVKSGEANAFLSQQNAFAWPAELAKNHTYTLDSSYSFDSEALNASIMKLELFSKENMTEPTDAYIHQADDGTYEIVDETPGNTPNAGHVIAEITAAVSAGASSCTLTDECYETPAVTASSPELTDAMSQIDAYQNATIHYEIDGADENLTASDIASMLVVKGTSVSVDKDKVAAFVQRLASTYNTYGDVRTFKTTEGDKVKIGGGDYGWVINKSEETAQIIKDLKGKKPVSREPVYEQTAKKSGTNDIGNTYVELDYTNQHLYYYKKGKLILDSDFVSGTMNNGNGSPDGIFKIVYKESPAVLKGESYDTDVDYFMPFAYNVGIHDAAWRHGVFGGEIYRTSGSHGCINVPGETAQELYKILEVGTPVVAYYREKVKLTAKSSGISNAYSYVGSDN